MSYLKSLVLIVGFTALFGLANPASANPVFFDTFGPGDSYDLNTGSTISVGSPIGIDSDVAMEFIPTISGNLYKIELAVARVDGINDLDVWLMSDNSGEPGSTIIEQFSFTGLGTFGQLNPLLSALSVLNPYLVAGTQYWLVASATGPNAWLAWNWSDPVVMGTTASRSDMGSWSVGGNRNLGAFRLTAIPEPTSLLLLGTGLGVFGLAAYRRRRKQQS